MFVAFLNMVKSLQMPNIQKCIVNVYFCVLENKVRCDQRELIVRFETFTFTLIDYTFKGKLI